MTAFAHAAADLATGLMWLWALLGVFILACTVVFVALVLHEVRHDKRAEKDAAALEAAVDMARTIADESPIYAHIARHAAAGIDREWAEWGGGAS